MPVFGPSADLFLKVAVCGIAAVALGAVLAVWGWPRSDYATGIGTARAQAVPFSHKHHAGELGIDCRYCHGTVETAASAGMPPTYTCMTCHSQIWTSAPMLAPVRESLAGDEPLRWRRVHDLPDYVYFDHSIHIAKGVGCTTCHGPVGRMPLAWKASSLTMAWCLDCHRDPAPNLRPRDRLFDPGEPPRASPEEGARLMAEYHVRTTGLTDCSTCHR